MNSQNEHFTQFKSFCLQNLPFKILWNSCLWSFYNRRSSFKIECFDNIEYFVRIECFDQRRNVLKLFLSYVFFSVVVGKEIKSKSIQLDNIFDATLICFHYFCNLMHFSNKVFWKNRYHVLQGKYFIWLFHYLLQAFKLRVC